MTRLLLTSFTTWLPHQKSNSSDDLLTDFLQHNRSIDLHTLRKLPVDFVLAPQQAIAYIQKLQPQAVVCCGMAESRSKLTVESQAVQNNCILKTGFNLPELVDKLPMTEISHDAGRFVCNATYFAILKHLAVLEHLQNSFCFGLFVHVPILTDANRGAIASDFEQLIQRILLNSNATSCE